MAQLSCQQAELPAMMCLVGDKVVEEVHQISREVLARCWRDRAPTRCPEPDHVNDALATAFKSTRQVFWFDRSSVDSPRHRDTMVRSDHLDPHTPGVVNVRRQRANRAARRTGNGHGPQLRWQLLDEID